ncbi:DUF6603 domain-containing protein [Plantactinospora sp. WMMC1484]|uniref:DUF6603 domain-containing protein n=1 Tax=Plantactinospora sp. WMMC1484 TaxID=3404122 RepID=UPI003BF505CC
MAGVGLSRAELEALLSGSTGGQLDLPVDRFGAPVATYLGRFVPLGRLTLAGVSRDDTAPGAVSVTGAGTTAPFIRMTVTVRFALTGDTVDTVTVTAAAGAAWSLADAFPSLAGTMLADLRFDQPVLKLDSGRLSATSGPAPDPVEAPMTFTGSLRVTGAMAAIALLFPGESHPDHPGVLVHPMTGEITMLAVAPPAVPVRTPLVPLVVLFGAQGHDLDLGITTVRELRYELVGQPRLNRYTVDHEVAGYLLVTGAVPVQVTVAPGVTQTRRVLITSKVSGWTGRMVLTADFSDLGPVTVRDVARFAGLDDLPVPFGIEPGPGVVLDRVSIAVNPAASPPVDYLTMTVFTEAEWTIIEDLLTLEQIDLNVRVGNLADPYVAVLVSGLFGIGDSGVLELAIDARDRAIGGDLRDGDEPLSIREVYRHFTKSDPGHLPTLDVLKFQANAELPEKGTRGGSFAGEIVLSGSWPVADGIDVHDVEFDLAHTPEATTFHGRADFVVHDVTITVETDYDPAPTRQWEFAGSTGPGQQIPLGALVESLAERYRGLTLPAPLAGLVVEDLGVEFSTGSGRLFATGQLRFPVDGTEVALTLTVDTDRRSFAGQLALEVPVDGGVFQPRLDLHLAADPTARRLAASYRHGDTDPLPSLRALVGAVSHTAVGYLPDRVVVDLRRLVVAQSTPAAGGSAYAFAVDLNATLDLAGLPVVGEHLGGDAAIGLAPLRLLAATAALTGTEVAALNALLPADVAGLPAAGLAAGFTVDATLRLGTAATPVTLPVSGAPGASPPPAGGVPNPPANQTRTGDNAVWLRVQRTFGPVQVNRIGLAWQQQDGDDPRIAVLLDATLTAGGLTLALSGLAAGLSAARPASPPSFDLAGLGLAYRNGGLAIDGAFLKTEISYAGQTLPAYGGAAQLRYHELSLSAIGSYTRLPSGPSVFVYAWLDYPLGGPPFFHVKGLAVGFGYHRRLVLPPVTEIASFPLVAEAIGLRTRGATLADELHALADWLPPSTGDLLLAAGVHFDSFKMVDSFVLLTAAFGHRFELDLLGLATLTLPAHDDKAPPVTPVAQVQLALRASLVPEDGYLTVLAQLTRDSYVLSRDCHLSGGFAFSTWFDGPHDGDFAITAGGYHPHFAVPAHYPTVPRLGFAWKVSDQFSLSGTAYYALTPSTLMAGGTVSAIWQDGSLRASFDAAMDFLIAWQPYHYEASLQVRIAASYTYHFFGTHTINVQVGTDVRLWGPNFGGAATIDLGVTSITIGFGAGPAGRPDPVDWTRFRDTLLPERDRTTTVTLRATALRTAEGADADELGLADPATLELTTDSAIPATRAVRGAPGAETALSTGTADTRFGVGPLGIAPGGITSTHRITITRNSLPADGDFDYVPVLKGLPYAQWGGRPTPSAGDPALVENLLTGYVVRPHAPAVPANSPWVDRAELQLGTDLYRRAGVIRLDPPPDPRVRDSSPAERAGTIASSIGMPTVRAAHTRVAAAVLPDAAVDLTPFDITEFHEIPQVAVHA